MRRKEMIELHDHPSFPAFLRNLVTDALQALWQFGNSYGAILPRLSRSLAATAATEILDLCSGGGGPWLRLSRQLHGDYRLPIRICLTDKYPNREAFEQVHLRSLTHRQDLPSVPSASDSLTQLPQIGSLPYPVDARRVPARLGGFRTMFSSFHHFSPQEAREILNDAVDSSSGIAIFEVARRSPRTLLVLCFTPFLVLLITPFMRPFRWSRLFWTYILPVIPFVIWYDGWISCLRAYHLDELKEMIVPLQGTASTRGQPQASSYRWELGEERSGLLPVTYLIGYPVTSAQARTQATAHPVHEAVA